MNLSSREESAPNYFAEFEWNFFDNQLVASQKRQFFPSTRFRDMPIPN